MTIEAVTINLLGKPFQIKCPAQEVEALKRSALYLEEQMKRIGEHHTLLFENIVVVAALNLSHQFMTLENRNQYLLQNINQRLQHLQSKIEGALFQQAQLELQAAE